MSVLWFTKAMFEGHWLWWLVYDFEGWKGERWQIKPNISDQKDPNQESTLGWSFFLVPFKFWFTIILLTNHRYSPPACVLYHVFKKMCSYLLTFRWLWIDRAFNLLDRSGATWFWNRWLTSKPNTFCWFTWCWLVLCSKLCVLEIQQVCCAFNRVCLCG